MFVDRLLVSPPQSTINIAAVSIVIAGAYLRYHNSAKATLAVLKIHIHGAAWTCILGRSGCGKSSLLRYLADFLTEKIEWPGEINIYPECDSKDQVACMAQQDLLMPWLSVFDNVMLSTKFGAVHLPTEKKSLQLYMAQTLLQKWDWGMKQITCHSNYRVVCANVSR